MERTVRCDGVILGALVFPDNSDNICDHTTGNGNEFARTARKSGHALKN